jgi:nondiscriminating glutamyl-tRNA synthetase
MSQIRVRFAPSPTGHMHVGNARTALFNWLYARNKNGVFVLRIEDTDMERSTKESACGIVEAMKWMGLDWDEGPEVDGGYGPYFQSERLDIYREAALKLVEKGQAYYCYCSAEELTSRREQALKEGRAPGYDGKCRNLSEHDRRQYELKGIRPTVRFKVNEATIIFDDAIRGPVQFDSSALEDFVILKSDGVATYNFAVVLDDALMHITDVIRGEDHIPNTPKQILLYNALGYPIPRFAHIPMILGPDRARLSKRHGATSVEQYRELGVVREAFVNYLSLLGWGYDDKQQLFTIDELIEKFSLERVSKNAAIFDPKKLEWMNGKYIRDFDLDRVVQECLPYLKAVNLLDDDTIHAKMDWIKKIIASVWERLKYLSEVVDATRYFFTDDIVYHEEAVEKVLRKEGISHIFDELMAQFEKIEFSEEKVEQVFRGLADELGLKAKDVIQPARVAFTGSLTSPGIFEVAVLLGKDTCIKRLIAVKRFLQ